jgi:hypothetical protein
VPALKGTEFVGVVGESNRELSKAVPPSRISVAIYRATAAIWALAAFVSAL